MGDLMSGLTLAAALGAGLVAGIFFAFSAFIMAALKRLPPEGGISAMQSINVAVLNPVFFLVFFGTAVAALILAIAHCRMVAVTVALSACGRPTLSRRNHLRYDGFQCAPQQQACRDQPQERRGCERLEDISFSVDGLESYADDCRARRVRVVHPGFERMRY